MMPACFQFFMYPINLLDSNQMSLQHRFGKLVLVTTYGHRHRLCTSKSEMGYLNWVKADRNRWCCRCQVTEDEFIMQLTVRQPWFAALRIPLDHCRCQRQLQYCFERRTWLPQYAVGRIYMIYVHVGLGRKYNRTFGSNVVFTRICEQQWRFSWDIEKTVMPPTNYTHWISIVFSNEAWSANTCTILITEANNKGTQSVETRLY